MSDRAGAEVPSRRQLLRRVTAAAVLAGVPATWWLSRSAGASTAAFASLANARDTMRQLLLAPVPPGRGAWDLPQVLHHAAQSIEYSVAGFPSLKPAWFRSSVGPVAAQAFSAAGRMHHDLSEPIPGAPLLANGGALAPAVARLLAALDAFEQHPGPLAPHFAYGVLDKPAYARAHLLHLADHWREFV